MEICGAFQNRIFLFMCACFSGILFALVWRKYEQTVQISLVHNHYISTLRNTNYNYWLKKQNKVKKILSEEKIRYSNVLKQELETENIFLYHNTPILCLIFVNSHKGAEAVKQTWAKHCNIVTFFGRFVDNDIPVIKVPPVTSFEGFCCAFVHVYQKYANKFKWIFIADDYTYAIIDNLRYYVTPLNSSFPFYLGHPVRDFSSLYNIGSGGIVLSQGSLSLLHSIYETGKDCISKRPPSWYFDQSIGKILATFNVHPVDTRDIELRSRFNIFPVETMIIPGSISVFSSYWRTSAFLSEEGMNCCSDQAITFHGIMPTKMFLLEYILYHLTAFTNSFKGLGNHKLNAIENHNLPKILNEYKKKEIGEPFIKLLTKNKSRFNAFKSKSSKINNQIIWNEIFER